MLGVAGSPRCHGNTDILIEKALMGAREGGADVELVRLRDLDIEHCQGCNSCFDAGECRIDDDMSHLYRLIDEADVIILASPVYFSGLSSLMKQMIDRCQCLWARKEVLGARIGGHGRTGALISVGGQNPPTFRNSVSVVKSYFNSIDVDYRAELLVASVDEKGDIMNHPSTLEEAYDLGASLVSDVR